MLYRCLTLALIVAFSLCHNQMANAEESWIEDALQFASDVEEDIFSSTDDDSHDFEASIGLLPDAQKLDTYQALAFSRSVALNIDGSIELLSKYENLLRDIGTSRHRSIQDVISALNEISDTGDYDGAEIKLANLAQSSAVDPAAGVVANIALAYVRFDNGNEAAALRALQNARRLSANTELVTIFAIELEQLTAYVSIRSGAQKAVLEAYRKSYALHKQANIRYESSDILSNVGWMLQQSGAVAESRYINQKLIAAISADVGDRSRFLVFLDCGSLELQAGNYIAAYECLEKAGNHLDAIPERRSSWDILYIRALAQTGRADLAKAHYDAFLADPKTQNSGYARMHLPFLESEVLYALGETKTAYEKLSELRDAERIRNAKREHASSLELRNLLELETRQLTQNAELKETLLGRQRALTTLAVLFAILLAMFCAYLAWNRSRERELSITDPLTKVLNRRGFWHAFEKEIETVHGVHGFKALGLVDLDGFKSINDVYGHSAGDYILTTMATRLRELLGDRSVIGRLGGDEFAIVLKDEQTIEAIKQYGASICEALGVALEYRGVTIKPAASLGLVVFADSAESSQDLYDCADYALYSRKQNAPGSAQLFDLTQKAKLGRNREIETALYAADLSEFYLMYQPMIDGETGSVKGFEALLRWSSSTLGDIAPKHFIPIAERTARIRNLSMMVIEQALSDAEAWPSDQFISINLSSQDIASVPAAQSIADLVTSSKISPSRIIFEVKETSLNHDKTEMQQALDLIVGTGAKLSLDKFGMGSSSLKHLNSYPIKQIKIDPSITAQINRKNEASSILTLLFHLCESLDIECVVNGVEKPRQREWLRSKNVSYLQGFIFARPMEAEAIRDFLDKEEMRQRFAS